MTLKPGLGSLKVIKNYTIQSGAHDFLLITFRSNHRPISHRFLDKRRYPSKIARKSPISPSRVFNAPDEGVPLGIVYRRRGLKKLYRMVVLSGGRKSFQIGLAVLLQFWRVTYTHPASHPRCRSKDAAYYYVEPVKIEVDQKMYKTSIYTHVKGGVQKLTYQNIKHQ